MKRSSVYKRFLQFTCKNPGFCGGLVSRKSLTLLDRRMMLGINGLLTSSSELEKERGSVA